MPLAVWRKQPFMPVLVLGKTPTGDFVIRRNLQDPKSRIAVPGTELVTLWKYYLGGANTPEGIAMAVEHVAMHHSHMIAMLCIYDCIKRRLDLSQSWMTVRHVVHDTLRHVTGEYPPSDVYGYSLVGLIKCVESYYEGLTKDD